MLNLETLDDGRKLVQNFVGLLVIFDLSGNELRKVAEGLGCVQNLCSNS